MSKRVPGKLLSGDKKGEGEVPQDVLDTCVRAFLDKIGSTDRRRVQLYLPPDIWVSLDRIVRDSAGMETAGQVLSGQFMMIARILESVPRNQQGKLAQMARADNRRYAVRGQSLGIRAVSTIRDCRKTWIALPPRMWRVFAWYARVWGQSLDQTLSQFLSGSLVVDFAKRNIDMIKREEDYDHEEEEQNFDYADLFDTSGEPYGFQEEDLLPE